MKRTILLYGASLAALLAVLKAVQYHYLIHDLSIEIYIGLVAVFFTGLGIWAGLGLTRKTSAPGTPFVRNDVLLEARGISERELEVLHLLALGHSNQEIADKLFISLNTVKTHTANLFSKLEVSRRTQAIQKGREWHLIP